MPQTASSSSQHFTHFSGPQAWTAVPQISSGDRVLDVSFVPRGTSWVRIEATIQTVPVLLALPLFSCLFRRPSVTSHPIPSVPNKPLAVVYGRLSPDILPNHAFKCAPEMSPCVKDHVSKSLGSSPVTGRPVLIRHQRETRFLFPGSVCLMLVVSAALPTKDQCFSKVQVNWQCSFYARVGDLAHGTTSSI